MKSKAFWLCLALTVPGWGQDWTHRVWSGDYWGEPAQLEEWSGPQGYQRHLSLTGFPWSEWNALDASGMAVEVDCNGQRRKLEGSSRRSLFLRWYFESKQWRQEPLSDLKIELDEQKRPHKVDFGGHHQVWDYSQGVAFEESDESLERPEHFHWVSSDAQAPPPLPSPPALPAQSLELPLSLVGQRWTQLSVVLDGKPELFLVDSGASNNVIDSALVSRSGWRRVGRQNLKGGLFHSMGWAQLPGLQVGGQEFGPLQWLELDLNSSDFAAAFPGVQGILGYDFLSQYTVQIDYPASRLRLLAGPFQPGPDDHEVEVRPEGPGLSVAMNLSGQKGYFTVDTGSGGGILVHHLSGQKQWVRPQNLDLYDPEGANFGSGKAGTWPATGTFGVGPFVWKDAPLEVVDEASAEGASLQSDGNLGVGFLHHFRVTLDLRQGRMWLAQVVPFRAAHRATFGLRLKPSEGRWRVSRLPAGGPAARAGLRQGDQIVDIQGLPPQGLPTRQFLEQAREGEKLEVNVLRAGQKLHFSLEARAIDP